MIAHLKMFKLSVREVARRFHRHHSTISRELKRNGPRYPGGAYWYDSAQARTLERKAKPRHQRRRATEPPRSVASWFPARVPRSGGRFALR